MCTHRSWHMTTLDPSHCLAPKRWRPLSVQSVSSPIKSPPVPDESPLLPNFRCKIYLLHKKISRKSVSCRHAEGCDFKGDAKHAVIGLAASFLVTTAVVSSNLLTADSAHALDPAIVQTTFQRSCVGCHIGGGNIIQPGATLTSSDLQRNGLSSVGDIYKIIYSGKGRMPGFGELCVPRGQCTFGPRLSDEEIQSLAEFVRLQADQGWKNLQ